MNFNPSNYTKSARIIGTLSLITGILIFLVQGRYDLNSIDSAYLFFGINFSLGALGIFCAKALKETKGARTLLGVSLCSMSAHFAQVGSFILSKDFDTAVIFGSLSLLLLPAMVLGFKVFDRDSFKVTTSCFLLGSIILLIPTRSEEVIIPLAIGALVLFYFVMNKTAHRKTFEAAIAKVLAFTPIALVLIRNTYYPTSLRFYGVIFGMLGFCLMFPPTWISLTSHIRKKSELISVPLLVVSVGLIGASIKLPIEAILFAEACVLNILRIFSSENKNSILYFSGFISLLLITKLFMSNSIYSTALGLLVSTVLIAQGWHLKKRGFMVLGGFGLIASIALIAIQTVSFENLSLWKSLAILGALVVLTASALERYLSRFQLIYGKVKNRFDR